MKRLCIFIAVATLSIFGSSCSEIGGSSSSPAELDSLIEEVWLEDLGTEVPLDQWLGQSSINVIDFINRKDALALHKNAKDKYSVNLSVIVDSDEPNWTQFIIARIEKVSDKAGLKALLSDASSENQLEVEFGNKWLSLGGKYMENDSGEYLKK